MRKKILLLLAVVSVSFQITSCTSSKSEDESEVIENADVEKIEADESLAETPVTSDPSMEAALGENSGDLENLDAATPAPADSGAAPELPTDVAAAPTLDETSLDDVPPPATADAGGADLPPPITNEVATTEAPVAEAPAAPAFEASSTGATEAPPKPADTLKKVALTTPYQTPAGWVNTVYIARPGETLKDISQKIFAADKTKDLKKIAENKYLKWRSARPGDKIYYVSPNRPDDSAKTLLYYEDMGMVPETYVAQKGDNLKKVAKKILGYDKAYVEMWTSNPVESKSKLAEGEVLKYWQSASGVTGDMASNPNQNQGSASLIDANQAGMMPPAPDMGAAPPQPDLQPPQDTASLPPPPMPDAPPSADMMPPPPQDTASLPPPPPADVPPPPPPVDEVAAAPTKKAPAQEDAGDAVEGEGLDNDTMMSLGAVGVLTAALAFALIHRKKKKAAEMAAAMNETHVGS